MSDVDCANDLALLTNAQAETEYLLHNLNLLAEVIVLKVNANKSLCVLNQKEPSKANTPVHKPRQQYLIN